MSNERSVNPFIFYGVFTGSVALLAVIALSLSSDVPLFLAIVVGINVAGLMSMGLDKSLARSSSLRIPEAVLYVQALLGGCPGILLGIHVFKHKTRKAAFQFVLLLIVVAQVALLRVLDIDIRPDRFDM